MIIVGTSGHALDILSDGYLISNFSSLYFFNSVSPVGNKVLFDKFKILTDLLQVTSLQSSDKRFIIATGNPWVRKTLYKMLTSVKAIPFTYTSPTAIVSESAIVGIASNIMPFSAIMGNAKIGVGCLINTHASIHHDTCLGEFCEISPGARILGHVKIGDFVQVGSNATILPGIKIGNSTIIGAGAVVTTDLPDNCTAVGVPAKIIKSLEIRND